MRLHVHEWGDPEAPPLVCLHGVSAHGRRFRKLAEERLAGNFRDLAPDLRGHGRSGYDPPWDIGTHLDDVLETARRGRRGKRCVDRAQLRRAARARARRAAPERLTAVGLLDPAIQILPHVGFDFAQAAALDHSFASVEEAIESRLASGAPTPREFVEEEAREHLAPSPDGRLRWQFCRAAVVTAYSELCTDPPPPTVLSGAGAARARGVVRPGA